MPERADAIREEVVSLKAIVNSVLDQDFEGAVEALEMRKESLIG